MVTSRFFDRYTANLPLIRTEADIPMRVKADEVRAAVLTSCDALPVMAGEDPGEGPAIHADQRAGSAKA
jgi:hypothetical protein